ncbi:MAG: HU family DNA-binding protein [Bacteroidota bacterium]
MMLDTVSEDVLRAFSQAVREQLMNHRDVTVPGLGRFSVAHEPSRVVESEAGQRTLHPPVDAVAFESEPEPSSA